MITLLFALAFGADIEKTGLPDQDKLFAEVGNLDFVLQAADQRMDKLLGDVNTAMKLPGDTPLAYTVWSIKQAVNGDVRMMVADERPILALGDAAPANVKEAAGMLNEGTQEVAVMARDIARLPARMNQLVMRSKKLPVDDAAFESAGIDKSTRAAVEGKLDDNREATNAAAERAQQLAERAQGLLQAVREGMTSTETPAGGPEKAAAASTAPAPKPAPAANADGTPSIGATVQAAWDQFNDAELDAAVELLAQADLLLPRQKIPVTRGELLELFMTRALVNLVKGDATAAAWSATQALVVHPGSRPDAKFGPQYAKLHKALAKAGLVRSVEVTVTGSGKAFLSGVEVTGGSTVQLGQGQHLLQIQKDGAWKSSIVYVQDGFTVEL